MKFGLITILPISKLIATCIICVSLIDGLGQLPAQESETESPLPPDEAARTMVVPDGFQVTLFAGEPDVKQPIGFCIDDRGRLWVAEAYNYPNHGTKPGDRIVILEDVDVDGRFDKRTVFYDKLNYVTGIEVGFGGAWVMSPPYFYFIPDRDGDDRPDEEPQILLDGFGNHANSHNLANAFAWGPDGWLYGTHGRTNWSKIGKPGTPDDQRVVFDGGVYRYHPVRHVWEPFADGTTNPWGIDWNDCGQGFVCNCVNPHLFQVIQGAHYEPWRNRKSSQYAYERIPTIADHLHFVGTNKVRDGLGTAEEDRAGGGHAHCGTMIYLGDNWPDEYRNQVFMHNIHGKRINNDILRRSGSGYTASHGPDLMYSKDQWYMGVTLQYGPDGAVYSSDWSDTGECHSVKNTRRETGRIFKIAYGQPEAEKIQIAKLEDHELVDLQLHRNDWYVRHARRLLQERAAAGGDLSAVHHALRVMFVEQPDVPRKLRALWALHVTERLDRGFLLQQLEHESEYVRAWAIQLLCENPSELPQAVTDRFNSMALSDNSPLVRLYLASALQRLSPLQRWPIAEGLLARAEDANDVNLPLMDWYGIEPLIAEDLDRFVGLAGAAKIPLVRRHIARRVAEDGSRKGMEALVAIVQTNGDDQLLLDLLGGILQGIEGRRSVKMPENWAETYVKLKDNAAVRQQALRLALVFDDPIALASLRKDAADKTVPAEIRNEAIQALVAKKASDFAPQLIELVKETATRNAALRGLAEYENPRTVEVILENYPAFDPSARQDAVQTLASRPQWAMKLMDAVEAQQIARTDLTAFTARQLQNLGNEQLSARVAALWGEVRTTPADKAKLIANYKKQLTPESLQLADRSAGRAVFQANCANCHRLFDNGGNVGPEITGAQRTNLDYLLENLVDPSAAVAKDYQMQIIETVAGRTITGLVIAENENAITVQTANEKLVVPIDEIEKRSDSLLSVMPDGLLQQLSIQQIVNLVAYLESPQQVPLPEAEPIKE